MKVNFGAIIVDGRGKLGGHVGQRNASGNILRTKTTPTNRRSPAQQSRRSLVAELTRDWKFLTEAQRIQWNNFANENPDTDIFGNVKTNSGFNMFVEVNLNLVNVGEEKDLEPGTADVVVDLFYEWDVELPQGSPSAIIVTWKPPITATTKIIVYATSPISPGIASGGSRYRQIAVLDDTAISPYTITDQYKAKFGGLGNVGNKIFVKATQINLASGLASPPLIASDIVPALVPPP